MSMSESNKESIIVSAGFNIALAILAAVVIKGCKEQNDFNLQRLERGATTKTYQTNTTVTITIDPR